MFYPIAQFIGIIILNEVVAMKVAKQFIGYMTSVLLV